ncbi:hypothetical protein ALC57_11612 [Trachymyrmex cornetzi]|uniref:Uncharacterized protein n=1 Tax=Trachymyrmex cornetzi TaxID=471704 RepID=A0A195DTH0_9HYME|nr:hypothetical protein ALC57_11612 [Trachymyrmex cornetzi]
MFFCELTRQCAYHISRILTIEYFNSRYFKQARKGEEVIQTDYFIHCQSSFVYHLDSHRVTISRRKRNFCIIKFLSFFYVLYLRIIFYVIFLFLFLFSNKFSFIFETYLVYDVNIL